MMKLKNVFSDHALFQQETVITVSGWGKQGAMVEISLNSETGKNSVFEGTADADGRFDVCVSTPAGGWEKWKMTVSDGEDKVELEDILFGEVWLAGGQSNMEMFVSEVYDRDIVRPELKDVRFYQLNPLELDKESWGGDPTTWGVPRTDDVEDANGLWGSDRTPDLQDKVSCIALVACADMAKKLGIPVGFMNYNLGATSIETWLPYTRMEEFPELAARLKEMNLWPDEKCHNCSVLYHNVAPGMYGLKFRGAMWYQGEANTGYKDAAGFYRDALIMWHKVYSDLFATDKGFPMLCALLFPWYYGDNTTCRAQVNRAIVRLASEQPEKFCVIPTYDLPPVWSVNQGNHPIHPAHKTMLGRRFSKAALAAAYGYEGMRSAAWMKDSRIEGSKVILSYETGGRKIEASGELDGFMICGADGVWQHAHAKIISDTEVAVWNDAIEAPVNALYQYLDTQLGGGLKCGELPCAPAAAKDTGFETIRMRQWTDLKNDGTWIIGRTVPGDNGDWKILEAYYRPTWRPGEDSEICRDKAFTRTGCALRIAGDASPVSAWVKPYQTMTLDLDDFGAMTMDVFCYQNTQAHLEIQIQKNECDVRTVRIPGYVKQVLDDNWAVVEFALNEKLRNVVKLKLVFDVDRPVKGVNIDRIMLWPKK